MVCLVCSKSREGLLCGRCRSQFVPGPTRRLRDGVVVTAGWRHAGPARVLVHRLKYQGIRQAAWLLAVPLAPRLDGIAGSLVPVPRALLRTWKYGVDPGWEIAGALGALTGRKRVPALRPPLWAPSRAGESRAGRRDIRFGTGSTSGGRVILVDDVLTTGATMRSAHRATGRSVIYGVTATSAGRVVM